MAYFGRMMSLVFHGADWDWQDQNRDTGGRVKGCENESGRTVARVTRLHRLQCFSCGTQKKSGSEIHLGWKKVQDHKALLPVLGKRDRPDPFVLIYIFFRCSTWLHFPWAMKCDWCPVLISWNNCKRVITDGVFEWAICEFNFILLMNGTVPNKDPQRYPWWFSFLPPRVHHRQGVLSPPSPNRIIASRRSIEDQRLQQLQQIQDEWCKFMPMAICE